MKETNPKRKTDEFNRLSPENFKLSDKHDIYIIIDNLRSGLNIGSIFRTADAFRLKKVFLTGISATPPNREILKTALGATETVDWEYIEDPIQLVKVLKNNGVEVYAVEQTLNSISLENFKVTPNTRLGLIFGNEVEGVDQNLINLCNGVLEIPQFGSKHSLNVSVSSGIVVWHIINQLLTKSV